jgi:hypothetical protein
LLGVALRAKVKQQQQAINHYLSLRDFSALVLRDFTLWYGLQHKQAPALHHVLRKQVMVLSLLKG